MQTAEIFGIAKKDLHSVVTTDTIGGYYCEFGGNGDNTFGGLVTLNMLDDILDFECVYFHMIFGVEGRKPSVIVDTVVRWEYRMTTIVKDLLHFHRTGEVIELKLTEKPKEEEIMKNYIIGDVEFSELNAIALKTSLKEIAKSTTGITIEKDGVDTYLVKNGTVLKLDSKEFQSEVQKYVVGKTMVELKNNHTMYNLITILGLISKFTMVKPESSLAEMLGE
jgi:hypothetical protein